MIPPKCFVEQPLISAGILDWLQGSLCETEISCKNKSLEDMDYLTIILKHITEAEEQRGPIGLIEFSKILCKGERSKLPLNWFNAPYHDFKKKNGHNCNAAKQLFRRGNIDKVIKIFENNFYYYPNNKKTELLVKKVNETFNRIWNLKKAAKDWRELYSEPLEKWLSEQSTQLTIKEKLLKCISTNRKCATLLKYLPKLKNWTSFIAVSNVAFGMAESIIDCITFPKFTAAASRDDVFAQTQKDFNGLGLIFDGVDDKTTLNNVGHVTVKVSTNKKRYDDLDIRTIATIELFTGKLIEVITGKDITEGVTLHEMPEPCMLREFRNKRILELLYSSMQVILIICWMPGFCCVTIAIVSEKENRLTFTMRLMSVRKIQLWFGWFTYTMPFFVLISFVTVVCFHEFGVFEYSSRLLFFTILLLYSVVIIIQSFFIATCFHSSRMASIVAPGLYIFGTIIRYFLTQNTPKFVLLFASLIPQVALYYILKIMFSLEQSEIGLTSHTILSSLDLESNTLEMILALCFSGIILILLILYIEAVFPGEFGVALKWNFLCSKSYWKQENITNQNMSNFVLQKSDSEKYLEPDPKHLEIGIQVIELVKKYKKDGPIIVDSLNLNFYVDQVTAFLGHNGAGKTTTLSIIAGIFPPTSGRIIVNGYDIQTNSTMAQENLGLCPQHNVLFDYLTVEEHIKLYSGFKEYADANSEEIRKQILIKIDLYEKRDTLVTALSGGMKRRLSVGLAFLGNPTAVILDEPTAGVDPYARREIWDVILAHKRGRAVILTTHNMDEADILGDRIAILSKGQLKCCGTSLFLKRMLGHGYILNLCISNATKADVSMCRKYINRFVPNTKLVGESIDELTFELPRASCDNGDFQILFENLECDMKDLHVISFGLNNTSLETIFIEMIKNTPEEKTGDIDNAKNICCFPKNENNQLQRIDTNSFYLHSFVTPTQDPNIESNLSAEDGIVKFKKTPSKLSPTSFGSKQQVKENTADNSTLKDLNILKLTGVFLWITQFLAIFQNRFIFIFRSKAIIFAQYVMPILFIIASIICYDKFLRPPSERFQRGYYIRVKEYFPWYIQNESNFHVFYSNEDLSNAISRKYAKLIETSLGLGGVRCMNSRVYEISSYPCQRNIPPGPWSVYQAEYNPLRCELIPKFDMWPVRKQLASTDYLYKLPKYTTEAWLHELDEKISKFRYAGFSFGKKVHTLLENDQIEVVKFFKSLLFINVLNSDFWGKLDRFLVEGGATAPSVSVLWHKQDSRKPYETAMSYLGILMNLYYRINVRRQEDTGISIVLNDTTYRFSRNRKRSPDTVKYAAFSLIRQAFTLSICSVLLFIIDERVSVSKYLQIISGVQPCLYWLSNFVWDMLNVIILIIITLILFRIIGWWEFVTADNISIFILYLLLFGSAALMMMYVLSHFGNSPGKFLLIIFITIELISDITEIFVKVSDGFDNSLSDKIVSTKGNVISKVANFLKIITVVIPHYSFKNGLFIIQHFYHNKTYPESDILPQSLSLSMRPQFYIQLACLIGYALILIILEYSPFTYVDLISCYIRNINLTSKRSTSTEDSDVANEKSNILLNVENNDAVRIKNLTKVYTRNMCKHLTAVSNMYLGLRTGECFGFLGVNGAGKTTSFKMMTGEIQPTEGDIFIKNINIRINKYKALQNVGYCPQFNGFCEKFTVREVISLHAKLCGVHPKLIDTAISKHMEAISLSPHANTISGHLSGGNKRKLSTCIALIGDPDVLFLDEPTSGMDTAARQELWNCIAKVVARKKCVLFTSHTLAECEIICQRACIMVSGKLRCLGSIQHLKNKFGRGYIVSIAVKNESVIDLKEYIGSLEEARLLSEHDDYLVYEIPYTVPLSKIFKILQQAKLQDKLIDDYAINQTSLDDIFIEFAKGNCNT